jgi:hypothetical protein
MPRFSLAAGAIILFILRQSNLEVVMAHTNPPIDPSEGERTEDGRADWHRPAVHRLKVNNAEATQKRSDDGVQGKGLFS